MRGQFKIYRAWFLNCFPFIIKAMNYSPENSYINRSTVGIVLRLKKTLHLVGTGLLVVINGELFAITAAHVIKGCRKYPGQIGILDHERRFLSIKGNWVCSGPREYGTMEDPIDVAAVHCELGMLKEMGGLAFIGTAHMDISIQTYKGSLYVFGYPVLFSDRSPSEIGQLSIRPLQVITHEFSGDTRLVGDYKRNLHILLKTKAFNPEDHSWEAISGSLFSLPGGLSGLSGCGVWEIENERGLFTEADPKAKLVALQTGVYNRQKLIKATRWSAVMGFMKEAFPGLIIP